MRKLPIPSYPLRVLILFTLASMLPLILLSAVLTGIAQSALGRSLEERGRLATWAFAERLSTIEADLDAALGRLAASGALRDLIRGDGSADPGPGERLSAEGASGRGVVYSLALVDGRSWSSGDFPEDWDLRVYASWGLPRRAREAGGRTAFMARPRVGASGRVYCLAAGRALFREGGEFAGMVAAELPRELLVEAAGSDRELLAFDAEIIGRGGIVAFALADPSREGKVVELPPFPPPPSSGIYEARLGDFVVRLLFPERLAAGLGEAMGAATVWGLAAAAFAAALLALLAARHVTRPVLALATTMERLRRGELGVTLPVRSRDEMGHLAASFNEMSAELAALVAAEAERAELLRRAELEALAARMNPHFLYNTLNSIKSLAKLGRNAEIVETVSRLGKLLRASAAGARGVGGSGDSTLGAELALVRDYVEIERIRFGSRVSATWELEPELEGLPIPGLVLEALAENAFLHGLERSGGAWELRVRSWVEGDWAHISFEDTGPGAEAAWFASESALLAAGEGLDPGSRIGLAATNRRLKLRFGRAAGLSVSPLSEDGRGFRAELRLPRKGASVPDFQAPGGSS